MGDADSEIIVPVNEIESWMDEALGVVDEGLDHLFLYMINVNDRTKQILVKLETLEYFRNLFLAMNLLIVPVVLSVLLCFSTRNTVDRAGLEVGYQLVVTFLMFLSGSLGLPLYVYSFWELYSASKQLKNDLVAIRQNVPRTDSGRLDSRSLSEDSFLTFISNETSLERYNDFARMLNDRMPGTMRADIGRRRGVVTAAGPGEENQLISMLTENSSNLASDGMIENSSESDFESLETNENISETEEHVSPNKNKAGSSKFVERDTEERESNQVVESDSNIESNLKATFSRNRVTI